MHLPHYPVSIDGGEPIPFPEFVAVNEFEPEEVDEIVGSIARTGVYLGGGGAAAEYRVERVTRPLCPVCANTGWIAAGFKRETVFLLNSAELAAQRARELAAPRAPCPRGCEPRSWDRARLAADAPRLAALQCEAA